MGVDFYACENCGETYADCGDYFSCDCGCNFCSTECGKYESREPTEEEREENDYDEYEEIKSCIFCRYEAVTDRQVLLFLCKKYGILEEDANKECIEDLKNGK